MDTASTASLVPIYSFMEHALTTAQTTFDRLPGSAVIQRYVRSSHQNDPGRTLLGLILVIFAIRTLLQSRTRAERDGKHFIQFSEKEVDELVDEWIPEPLVQPLTKNEVDNLAAVPIIAGTNGPRPKVLSTGKIAVNLASFNFTGLAGNEHIKQRAIDTLRKYGLGTCGPTGFYGTLDVHVDLENNISEYLGTEATILCAQGFATVSSVIPAFCKRGDIIVADRAVNFALQRGILISRSTVRWFDHNDLRSLEDTLISVEKERKKRRGPLARRFIITEGIFQKDGTISDLPKIIELKEKYKWRLILDEGYSFGTIGRTGRGLTELYNVPASKVDMILGSCGTTLASGGGFCAGSQAVISHLRVNAPSVVFSASLPALLAVSASEGINILRSTPSILETLQDNVRAARAILDRVECITMPSHPASPVIHIYVRQCPNSNTSVASASGSPMYTGSFKHQSQHVSARDVVRESEYDAEERLLQSVVEEALLQGVLVTRAKNLKAQEMAKTRPSIRLAMTSSLTKKETEKAVNILKTVLVKVLSKRR